MPQCCSRSASLLEGSQAQSASAATLRQSLSITLRCCLTTKLSGAATWHLPCSSSCKASDKLACPLQRHVRRQRALHTYTVVDNHEYRCSSKTNADGGGNSRSAKQPTATAMCSGFRNGSQYTVDPQVLQKWKETGSPDSDGRVKLIVLPSIVTASRRKKAASPNALPVRR